MPAPTTGGPSPADIVHRLHLEGLSKKSLSKDRGTSLPDSFYHSPAVYQLERRAIFSKRWFLVSHKARYRNIGDFVQYEMAGFNFVIVKNKTGEIVGFHNICRHRAFPIVQDTSGTAKIFSCKYHGWSYDLNGKLTKAPRFTPESVSDFDSSSVRLFPIHVYVDRNGFVYANLDARPEPEIAWKAQYGGLDEQDVLVHSGVDWDAVEYDFTWIKDGKFNWKLMQDNYNECYHCLTAHPSVAKTTALDTYYVAPATPSNYISHFSEPKPSVFSTSQFDATRFAGRSATHVFPVGHFSPNPGTGFMHLMRSIPTSATTTRQEYDVYRLNTPHATPEAHQRMAAFYQNVVDEDFALCEAVQRSLERGVFERGALHPFHEEGVMAFQDMIMKVLGEQVEAEEVAGRELWAARPGPQGQGVGVGTKQAVTDLCERILAGGGGVSCEKATARGLEW